MSKVTPPILTGIYPRKRLFARLDRMRKQPVIWVCGPPGCGKTTLVSSYLDARKLPCLWYQIDEGDADPATFYYYLGMGARAAAPQKKKPLPLLTPEYQQGIPTFTLRYFEELYNRLNPPKRRSNPLSPPMAKSNPPSSPFDKGGIKGGFVVVFDNYQEIPTNSPFHEVILNGLSIIPAGINVIIISRSDPPPALIRLRANHQMEVLAWDDLRLTWEESEGIVRQRSREKQTREAISHLHKAADGWAAGLVLMLESVERKVIEPQALGKLTPEEIIDYFGNELFEKTEGEIRDFLLKTAFFPKMTAKMAEDLTGLSHAGRILNTLSRTHYFTEKRFHGEFIYQYHPLFRDFLISRAKETFSPKTRSILIHGAATLLEEAGQTEDAAVLLRDARDWDGLVRLITKYAPTMLAQGRNLPLEDWLNSLPGGILDSNPWILFWMGSCRLPFHPGQSQLFFEKAFEQFKTREDLKGILLAWSGIVESIWFDLSDFKRFDKWISVLAEILHDPGKLPSDEIGTRVACSMFTALLIRQPQHPEIDMWSERLLASLEHRTNVSAKIIALARQVLYRMFTGDYVKLKDVTDSLRNLAQSRDASPLARLTTKFAESICHRFAGSHEKGLEAISDGLEISRITGIHILDRMFLYHGTLSALSVNDGRKAEEWMEKLESSSTPSKAWDKTFYHILKTRVALFQGNPDEAAAHAETALKFSRDVGSPLSLFICHLLKCHTAHLRSRERESAEHLNQAFHLAGMIKSKNAKFYALFARALFSLDQGKEELCLLSLREALAIGKEGKYFDTYIDRPPAMVRLCSQALDAGIEVEYVQELISKRNLIPEKPLLHLENWPWPLKIYTLGRFELLKDGKPIQFTRKTQRRPLALLKTLIAFGGKGVREDQIEDALWPEADGDIAHQSFKITLHRLRQLLGYEKAIRLQEGRLTLDPRHCWVDAWAFEQILEQAEALWKEGKKEVALGLMEKATEMYGGAFLSREIEQPWATSLRERLRGKFLRSVGRSGLYWQQAGRWEEALDCYHKMLEIDDLAEEFYQGLMTCHQHLGQRAEALSVYHRCKRALSQAFGVEPSPKTQAIYQFIMKRRNGEGGNR
ncbi:MAG: hypothetical protein FJ117_18770 [Deltaproteobacteria bacterium]|nr:hypothetical protein [Deltaproteobacteria bacterium]